MLSQVTSGVHVRLRWPLMAAVVFMHAVALGALSGVTRSGGDPHGVQHTPPVMTGFIIEERPTLDTVEIPEAFFERPNVQLQTITQVQFESDEWGDISQVVAPSSAPQLSRFQPVDPASFARRAGLTAGQVASVVLTVEVLPNGRTGTVEVLRGFGDAMVDAAAVAYARQTALDSRDSESSRTTDAHQFTGCSGMECIVGSRSVPTKTCAEIAEVNDHFGPPGLKVRP